MSDKVILPTDADILISLKNLNLEKFIDFLNEEEKPYFIYYLLDTVEYEEDAIFSTYDDFMHKYMNYCKIALKMIKGDDKHEKENIHYHTRYIYDKINYFKSLRELKLKNILDKTF